VLVHVGFDSIRKTLLRRQLLLSRYHRVEKKPKLEVLASAEIQRLYRVLSLLANHPDLAKVGAGLHRRACAMDAVLMPRHIC
jgi:hypothetical protein